MKPSGASCVFMTLTKLPVVNSLSDTIESGSISVSFELDLVTGRVLP